LHGRLANCVLSLVVAAVFSNTLIAATKPAPTPKRARPPKWSADVLDAFFPDARTKLVGTRPDYEKASAASATTTAPSASGTTPAATVVASRGNGWSNLIDAETIETEIKRLAQEVAKDVTAPAQFKGGGYKDCRREFSILAAMFGIAGEYDGDVRWKDSAPLLRDVFARAGRNCKVGTDQTFQEAIQRKQNLADLISGTRPKTSDAERKADWPQVADLPPLMQRMNIGQQDRLQKWLASKAEFAAHRDDVKHEAQMLATIADIISRPGYEYSDDDTYSEYARNLKQAESDVAAAVDQDNFDQARQAFGRASKACTECHEGYRQ
jgi:Cytochrome C'